MLPTYAVGEKVLIAGREFEVMAVISPLQPMVADIAEPAFHLPLVIPADVFEELWGESTVGVIVRAMAAGGFSTFRFTLLPLVCCSPILIVLAMAMPYLCFWNLKKHSVVERLRAERPCKILLVILQNLSEYTRQKGENVL